MRLLLSPFVFHDSQSAFGTPALPSFVVGVDIQVSAPGQEVVEIERNADCELPGVLDAMLRLQRELLPFFEGGR